MTAPRQWKARPTTYNGVKMRSRLEARFAAWMDSQSWEWVYEPECFASDQGQYLPDFEVLAPTPQVWMDDGIKDWGGRLFIEVKPTLAHHRGTLNKNAQIIEACLPTALLVGMGHSDPEGAFAAYLGWVSQGLTVPLPMVRMRHVPLFVLGFDLLYTVARGQLTGPEFKEESWEWEPQDGDKPMPALPCIPPLDDADCPF